MYIQYHFFLKMYMHAYIYINYLCEMYWKGNSKAFHPITLKFSGFQKKFEGEEEGVPVPTLNILSDGSLRNLPYH